MLLNEQVKLDTFPTDVDHRRVVLNVDMKTRPDRSH